MQFLTPRPLCRYFPFFSYVELCLRSLIRGCQDKGASKLKVEYLEFESIVSVDGSICDLIT